MKQRICHKVLQEWMIQESCFSQYNTENCIKGLGKVNKMELMLNFLNAIHLQNWEVQWITKKYQDVFSFRDLTTEGVRLAPLHTVSRAKHTTPIRHADLNLKWNVYEVENIKYNISWCINLHLGLKWNGHVSYQGIFYLTLL